MFHLLHTALRVMVALLCLAVLIGPGILDGDVDTGIVDRHRPYLR
jgi:hypothetical protein